MDERAARLAGARLLHLLLLLLLLLLLVQRRAPVRATVQYSIQLGASHPERWRRRGGTSRVASWARAPE